MARDNKGENCVFLTDIVHFIVLGYPVVHGQKSGVHLKGVFLSFS